MKISDFLATNMAVRLFYRTGDRDENGSLGIPVTTNLLIFLQIIRNLSGRYKAVGRDDFG